MLRFEDKAPSNPISKLIKLIWAPTAMLIRLKFLNANYKVLLIYLLIFIQLIYNDIFVNMMTLVIILNGPQKMLLSGNYYFEQKRCG